MESYSQQELLQLEIWAPSPDPFTESCSDTDWHNRFIVTDEQTAAQWQSHYCCDVTGKQWGNHNDNGCSLNWNSGFPIDCKIDVSTTWLECFNSVLNLNFTRWNGLKFLKNNAVRANSRECIIFVKRQYPEVFTYFKHF